MKTLLLIFCFAFSVHAEVLVKVDNGFKLIKKNFKVSELLADYIRLNHLDASFSDGFYDQSFSHQGVSFVPENKLEKYVSMLMTQSGNTIIRMPNSNFIQIIAARDLRYATLPVYKDPREIPENDNSGQFSYVLKHIDAEDLSRNMRPFMGRYGRIIDVKYANSIHIADSGSQLRRQIEIVQLLDTPEFVKNKKEIDEINEKYKKVVTKEKSLFDILSQNSGIFLLVFLLLGLIIGFGTRGYMMKRVEGGW